MKYYSFTFYAWKVVWVMESLYHGEQQNFNEENHGKVTSVA